MGSIIPFFGGPDASLPPERAKLVRNGGERAGIAAKISVLAGMRQKLEGEFSKVGEAERERDSLIHRAARSLVDRLSGGGEFGFETLSRKAAVEGEKIATSQVKAKIIETAISEIDGELEQLSVEHAELEVEGSALVQAVLNEAVGEPLRVERAAAIENLREVLTRCAAVDRLLAPERPDWAPAARICIVLPNLVWADKPAEEFILAPAREIAAAQTVLAKFSLALESDPLAPMPEFSAVDPEEDPDLEYALRSAPERAQITRDAVYSTRQRESTREPRRFATQALDAAKAALGL